ELRVRKVVVGRAGSNGGGQRDEPVRARHGQCTQNNRVIKREDGSRRSDAERQRRRCENRKYRRPAPQANPVANILPEVRKPVPPPHAARLLFDPGGVAKRALSGGAIAALGSFEFEVVAKLAIEIVFAFATPIHAG